VFLDSRGANRTADLPVIVSRDGGSWQVERTFTETLGAGPQPMALSRQGALVLIRNGMNSIPPYSVTAQSFDGGA
jgi:hypothetical protein